MADDVRVRLLGVVDVVAAGEVVRLPPLERGLLAMLALGPGQVVTVDRAVDVLWGDRPPESVRNRVQGLVSTLRRTLGPRLATSTSGYRLDLDPELIDLTVFERRVAEARRLAADGSTAEAAAQFRAALRLWRGDPLSGVRRMATEASGLAESRLAALADRIEADLALGKHADLIPELTTLVAEHPARERFTGFLMLALYRSGRQADALSAFSRARDHLDEELGLDPGPELTRLHQQILRREPALEVPVAVRPAQLPRDVPDFTGRAVELARVTDLVGDRAATPGAVVVSVINGMAGIGKTTLAVHLSHRLADRYPDGQLFVDLRAHAAGHEPTEPAAALDTMLRSLGVGPERIPPTLDERAALWRSEVARRRMLVVLDNAAGAAQVRPLLPGAAGCLVLITSRNRLAALEGAHPVELEAPPVDDAVAMFTAIVGGRADAEPEAVVAVVDLCLRLPLAVRLAAARLRHRPVWTVAHLAERLRAEGRRLTELSGHEAGVAAAFALSYQHLDPEQRRMFRLLGLHPGVDTDLEAAAALAGVPAAQAERTLEALLDGHLLEQRTAGRYAFHDLICLHAMDCAHAEDDAAAAADRVLGYYADTARRAADLLDPARPALDPDPAWRGGRDFDDLGAAMDWFRAERQNLSQAVTYAFGRGLDRHAAGIARELGVFLSRVGLHAQCAATTEVGLPAASPRPLPGRSNGHRQGTGEVRWSSRG